MRRWLALRQEMIAISREERRGVLVGGPVDRSSRPRCPEHRPPSPLRCHLPATAPPKDCLVNLGKCRKHRQIEIKRLRKEDPVLLKAVNPTTQDFPILRILPGMHGGELGISQNALVGLQQLYFGRPNFDQVLDRSLDAPEAAAG